MSSLIVVHDQVIMMLEVSVEKLYVPKTPLFSEAVMKKTVVMFRLMDNDWTSLMPNRADNRIYRGSNFEEELFYGGKSLVFSVPESVLTKKIYDVELQIHAHKEMSRFLQQDTCQNIGLAMIKVDELFNGIIRDLRDQKILEGYTVRHPREPLSRSMKGQFFLFDEEMNKTDAYIELYIRLSYFGKSIITEIDPPDPLKKNTFYVQEETNEIYPYQCRELDMDEILGGCWGSMTYIQAPKVGDLECACTDEQRKLACERYTKKQAELMEADRKRHAEEERLLQERLRKMREDMEKYEAERRALELEEQRLRDLAAWLKAEAERKRLEAEARFRADAAVGGRRRDQEAQWDDEEGGLGLEQGAQTDTFKVDAETNLKAQETKDKATHYRPQKDLKDAGTSLEDDAARLAREDELARLKAERDARFAKLRKHCLGATVGITDKVKPCLPCIPCGPCPPCPPCPPCAPCIPCPPCPPVSCYMPPSC